MNRARCGTLLVLLAASACVSGASQDSVTVLRSCPYRCIGSVGTAMPSLDAAAAADAVDGAPFAARVRLGTVDARRCGAIAPPTPGGSAVVVAATELERAFADAALVPSEERPLAAASDRAGVVTLVDERSYVSGFTLTTDDVATIADPQVGILQTGARLVVVPRLDGAGEAWSLDVTLDVVDARASLATEASLMPGTEPVRFDVPVWGHRRATSSATLAAGESLVIAAPRMLHGERLLVAVITPEPPAR